MCKRCRAGRYSWDCTGHSHKWWVVSGPLSQPQADLTWLLWHPYAYLPLVRYWDLQDTLRCCARYASTVMVGKLRMRWAPMCL